MDSFRVNLHAKGLSKELVILIANTRRPGTVSQYELVWRKWGSWCVRRKIDPIRCSMRDVVQFLTECFPEGFKCNTIAEFRSTISAYHDPIQSISVDKHPVVSDLLTSIFNKKHPQPKLNFIWHVKKIVNFLLTFKCLKQMAV